MPIEFTTDLHRYIYEKVRCFLVEAPEVSGLAAADDAPAFSVEIADERVLVEVKSPGEKVVVKLSVALAPALGADAAWLRAALMANAADGLAGVSLDPDGTPVVGHTLLGDACTRAELVAALFATATHAAALPSSASA